ncbi:MAG: CDC48 family AAA ATPase [Firmicutes bacterium]|nr:CDC48 family AAA ATPase [Bacillota bacterium]
MSDDVRRPEATLKVQECLPDDARKGIARIDVSYLGVLDVKFGDYVEIAGRRTTCARVVPAFGDVYGFGVIQIDGVTRENAGTAVGEPVRVRKCEPSPAISVVLSPLLAREFDSKRDIEYLSRSLRGLPVTKGDRVEAPLLGQQFESFTVTGSAPKGPVVITADTQVKVGPPETLDGRQIRVSYEDIGGLHRQVRRIRELIEMPVRFSGLFRRLGIEPPRGVLMYGPPGTGKTLIARAVASESDVHFIHVNGPEIMHKYYGESEARLREIFDEARRKAPSVIFLDELDALAPRRGEVLGDVEKRVVGQLLALMDGLVARGDVIVLAATNMPDLVDPALRRPGRFDREIPVPVPDKSDRLEILRIHTRGMALAPDVSLARLADLTHGFVGADLANLCREAGMRALRRLLPRMGSGGTEVREAGDPLADAGVVAGELFEITITAGDFLEALKEIEPSAMREFFSEVPEVRWGDIGALDDVKQAMASLVEWPMKHPDLYERAGITPPKGVLLSGPTGTGKTLVAKAVATETGVNFIPVPGPVLYSKWLGESEKAVRELFRKARQAAPCILFFDELDSIAGTRGHGATAGGSERLVSQLLFEIDGLEDLKGVVVLAATNRIDLIDPALLRPGRFDFIVEFKPPDSSGRLEILKVHTRKTPLEPGVDLIEIAAMTEGFTGSDLAGVCRHASILAVREYMARSAVAAGGTGEFRLSMRHFAAGVEAIRGQVKEGCHRYQG